MFKIQKKILEQFRNSKSKWYKYYNKEQRSVKFYKGSIYSFVFNNAKAYMNNNALEYFNSTIKYSKFFELVDKCSKSLKMMGAKKGNIITICMATCPESVIAFYAINKIGCVANIIHPLSSEVEISNCLGDIETSIIFVSDFAYDKVKNIDNIVKVVVPLSNSMDFFTKIGYKLTIGRKVKTDNVFTWSNFLGVGLTYKFNTFVEMDNDADAVILYSGGTTGKQKGVVLSNLCLNSVAIDCHAMIDNTEPGNSILSYLPIFHGFGLCISLHTPLSLGMKCILLPKLNTVKINEIVKKKKPTFLPVVPSLLEVIIRDRWLKEDAYKSVKCVLCGGDFLNPELRKKSLEFFRNHGSNCEIRVGYGLTECVASTCVSLPNEDGIGVPFPNFTYKIVKANTIITADEGEVGEIVINGPSVMKRYLNNVEETNKVLVKHDDGRTWLHTGDLGYMDNNGIFYFVSRLKRMIISNGFNIYPSYLEEVLCKHPSIATCVIIGVKDPIRQQAVKAIIVLKEGIVLNDDVRNDISKYAKLNIAKYAVPRIYEFKENLPKTKMGKVDYKELEKDSN